MRFQCDEESFAVTASFGIAELELPDRNDPGEILEALVQQADAALYKSKEEGRNRISRYRDIGCTL